MRSTRNRNAPSARGPVGGRAQPDPRERQPRDVTSHRHGRTQPAEAKVQADQLVRENVRNIAELEAAARQARTRTDRIIDGIATFCGSLAFVYLHALWFGLWLAANLMPHRRWHFDPFPFNVLTMVVSLQSIFLSTFNLISQHRQGQTADRRNHLDLQVNMLAEQENTQMLRMLERIEERLGIEEDDSSVAASNRQRNPPSSGRRSRTTLRKPARKKVPSGSRNGINRVTPVWSSTPLPYHRLPARTDKEECRRGHTL